MRENGYSLAVDGVTWSFGSELCPLVCSLLAARQGLSFWEHSPTESLSTPLGLVTLSVNSRGQLSLDLPGAQSLKLEGEQLVSALAACDARRDQRA